ncbi:MAG: phosphate ABC transporter permease subunit PstC, partial [Magnetococcales bacterium]|nr:phosphate ABC transporter permease subunit PstC [Magnetococcales bacterium]
MNPSQADDAFDARDKNWYIDKAFETLMFICGISAIVFVVGIFLFVFKEGMGFIIHDMNVGEFFLSPKWRPTSLNQP